MIHKLTVQPVNLREYNVPEIIEVNEKTGKIVK
jgi:hypothetical protein